jgi:hypothetical protein
MKAHWKAGKSCVLRGIVNARVWLAQSVLVVKDCPQETVLALLPGAQCAYPVGYWRWGMNESSGETRWQEASRPDLTLKELSWNTHRVLIFLEPGKYYSCFLFWEQATGRFDSYYINFQLPFRRSHCGFDTLDLELDLVIDPHYHWEWKDVDDYQAGIREGGILPEWAQEIERSLPEIFERINQHQYPLDGSWLDWLPDPDWVAPRLPEDWQTV